MAYQAELDEDLRQQVRRGFASNVLQFWPKVRGTGNVAVSGTPTYEIRRPGDSADGAPLVSGSATVIDAGGVSRLEVTVDASSSWELSSFWQCTIAWTSGGQQYVSTVYFDVCRDPWTPDVSLNNLVGELADCGSRLASQADRIATGRSAEQHAAVLGQKAWADVYEWLRQKSEADGVDLLPSMIADRAALRRVVVAQTLHRMFDAEGGDRTSESYDLAERWSQRAQERFAAMGPLRYDSGQDRTADSAVTGMSSSRVGRSWGGTAVTYEPGPGGWPRGQPW